jgi:hypothetical protein
LEQGRDDELNEAKEPEIYDYAIVALGDRVQVGADDGGGEGTVIGICDGALSVLLDDGRTVTATTYRIIKKESRKL